MHALKVHLSLVTILLLGLLILSGCAPSDLSITSIEVSQSIQTPTNTVPLVAQRGTVVRVIVGTGGVAVPVAGVTGSLQVFVNGVEITPAGGLSPVNTPFTAQVSPQRANENDTLYFELPALSAIEASADVDFRVTLAPLVGEANTANNVGEVNNLTFVNRITPSLYFTRIDYTPSGLGLPNLADIQAGIGDMFVRGIYPVNDADPNLYRQGLFPSLPYTEDANGDGILQGDGLDGDHLLSLLASCRQLIVNAGLGAANNTFLYGWLAGNPISGNGLGQISGFNAFGNTEPVRYQRTFAHELGHNFGLGHNSNFLDEVGWDIGARLVNNPAGNNTLGRVKPTTLRDIMVGGQTTDSAWVDTITHNFFLNSPILATGPDAGGDELRPRPRVATIQGIFEPEGRELIRLEPVFRFPWDSQPSILQQEGIYLAEVVDEQGNVMRAPFNAQVGDDASEEEARFGFFEVMVPVDPNLEIVSLRITDAQGEQLFGQFERSAPPEIRIIEPQPGAALGEETTVVWEVNDPDTPQEQLLYQLAYSPDGGQSWVPIAVDIPGQETSVTFNSTEIQSSEGQGVLRIFVSDGLNTAFADVTELTTLAGQLPPAQPTASLLIAFPISETELRVVFSDPLDPASAENPESYVTESELTILSAVLDPDDPTRVTLTTDPMDGKAMKIDVLEAIDIKTAEGSALAQNTSPRFIQGIASISETKRPVEGQFPFVSRFEGIVATESCGKDGGVDSNVLIDTLGFAFIHEQEGGPYNSIKIVTQSHIPGIEEAKAALDEGETVHVLWAGGEIRTVNGEIQLVDTGYMEGSIIEPPLQSPPPLPIKTADVSQEAAESPEAQSLQGVIVRFENVTIDDISAPDERGLRTFVFRDESGVQASGLLLHTVTQEVFPGQEFATVRGLVHQPELGIYEVIIEMDEHLMTGE